MNSITPQRLSALAAITTLLVTVSNAHAGLLGRYYNGWAINEQNIIDFEGISEAFSRVDSHIEFWDGNSSYRWSPIPGRGDHYGVEWTGYVQIEQAGAYGFGTISDDGSQVWIDGTLVVDNRESQWYDWEDNISEGDQPGATFPPLVLDKGFHEIMVRFYDGPHFDGIELWWLLPDAGPSSIPYHGTTFHGVPPTFNSQTNWQIVPPNVLFTEALVTPTGDFDLDGDVDAFDLGIWQTGFGITSGASVTDGDADHDGDVDAFDLGLWQTNFGTGVGSATVPEPTAALVILLAGTLAGARRQGVPRRMK